MDEATIPLIVNFAPTGVVPGKEDTPHVPMSPAEIVEAVHEAAEIGITVAHLHARDERGRPTSSGSVFGRILEGVRRVAPDLVVCVSLSGRRETSFERQCEPLMGSGATKPDMASVTLGPVNFARETSVNAPETIRRLLELLAERGVAPELEVFDVGMVNTAKYLIRKGMLRPPLYFNLILGNLMGAQADLLHAGVLVRELPRGAYWAMGGIGASQLIANGLALAAGGGVRVGLEDNLWYDRGKTRLATNRQLLKRIHRLAELHGRDVMIPAEFRRHLGLAPGRGAYGTEESG